MDTLKKEFASKTIENQSNKVAAKQPFHMGFRMEITFLLRQS